MAICLTNYVTRVQKIMPLEIIKENTFNDRFKKAIKEMEEEKSLKNIKATERKLFRHKARVFKWCIELITNNKHVFDLWRSNWASTNEDYAPDGKIVVLTGLEKEGLEKLGASGAVEALYCFEKRTAVILESDLYLQTRVAALGIACTLAEEHPDIEERLMPISGACVEVNGNGIAILGAPKCGKSLHAFALARKGKMHSDDFFFVDKNAKAYKSENAFFLQGNFGEYIEVELAEVNGLEFENRDTPLSRVIVRPELLFGKKGVTDRATLKHFAFLEKLEGTEALKKLNAESAAERIVALKNAYIIEDSLEKMEARKKFFYKLFKKCEAFAVNVNMPEKAISATLERVANCVADAARLEGGVLYFSKAGKQIESVKILP